MNIGFTYDLRLDYLAAGYGEEETAEFDQPATIDAIEYALLSLGHEVDRIGHARSLVERLARGDRWDLVFNICEGLRGLARESQVPAILDVYQIPYTFSDAAVLALCLDKALTKTVLRAVNVATPNWFVVRSIRDVENCALSFPVIAKTIAEGTGKGIDACSKISDSQALCDTCKRLLEQFQEPVLLEQFLPGREFTTGVLGHDDDARVVGTLEVLLRPAAIGSVYSYANKEQCEELVDCVLRSPAADAVVAEAENLALAAWRAVGGRDAGRLDLRCDADGRPQIIEINPIAGLHPTHSDLPMLWSALGHDYIELIDQIVKAAATRVSASKSDEKAARLSLTHGF